MAAALAAALAVGHRFFGLHWTWVALTAVIVCRSNQNRDEAVHKAAMRIAGAGAGTLAATVLSAAFPPRDRWSLVAIFVVLAVALWLRQVNYAYWAAATTALIALLSGYYGENGIRFLGIRLAAIAVGAALAVSASCLLLPISYLSRHRRGARHRRNRATAHRAQHLPSQRGSRPNFAGVRRAAKSPPLRGLRDAVAAKPRLAPRARSSPTRPSPSPRHRAHGEQAGVGPEMGTQLPRGGRPMGADLYVTRLCRKA
jgi:uncharacterized membrane protein YccC